MAMPMTMAPSRLFTLKTRGSFGLRNQQRPSSFPEVNRRAAAAAAAGGGDAEIRRHGGHALSRNRIKTSACFPDIKQSSRPMSSARLWKRNAAKQLRGVGEDVYENRVDLALSLISKLESISIRMTPGESAERQAYPIAGRWYKLASPYDFKTPEDPVPYRLLNWCILAYEHEGLAEPLWCMTDGSSMRTVWEMEAIKQRISADGFQAFNVFDYYDEDKATGNHFVRISLGLIEELASPGGSTA